MNYGYGMDMDTDMGARSSGTVASMLQQRGTPGGHWR